MSKEDVREMLGEPSKINQLSSVTVCYYGYPTGGDVWFDADEVVSNWSEP